jgi:uncharacterized membrane protein YeiB
LRDPEASPDDSPFRRRWPILAGLVLLLGVLHQDFWWWADRTLLFGFMPIGLFYHASFSMAAVCLWLWAVLCAWPEHLEGWADEPLDESEDSREPAA